MSRVSRKNQATELIVPETHLFRAGLYARLSEYDAESLLQQVHFLRHIITTYDDMLLVCEYTDNGISGTHFQRPAFLRMQEDIRNGIIDCIFIKDLSRLGRNYIETATYIEQYFLRDNIRLISVNDSFDSKEVQGDLLFLALKNITNDLYAKDISVKSASALRSKQKKGEYIGSHAPYGYRKKEGDRHSLVIEHESANIVSDIFSWRIKGFNPSQIADILTKKGVSPPSLYIKTKSIFLSKHEQAYTWPGNTVKYMLRNAVYVGDMVQGKKRCDIYRGFKCVYQEKEHWVVVKGTHEPIIGKEEFDFVQNMK